MSQVIGEQPMFTKLVTEIQQVLSLTATGDLDQASGVLCQATEDRPMFQETVSKCCLVTAIFTLFEDY